MMETVKDLISSMGSAKYRRRRFNDAADLARSFGGSAAVLARRGSDKAVVLAKKVGPKRGLIGLAVVGAAVGGFFLVRYLLAEREDVEDLDAAEDPGTPAGRRARKLARNKRKEQDAVTH